LVLPTDATVSTVSLCSLPAGRQGGELIIIIV
jgi:hypothetical protein